MKWIQNIYEIIIQFLPVVKLWYRFNLKMKKRIWTVKEKIINSYLSYIYDIVGSTFRIYDIDSKQLQEMQWILTFQNVFLFQLFIFTMMMIGFTFPYLPFGYKWRLTIGFTFPYQPCGYKWRMMIDFTFPYKPFTYK